MSLKGVLEDVPLADVLQFVHLGRRTGTLYMWQDEENRAEIGFRDGRIVSAWTPQQQRLGHLLVVAGVIEPATLESALEHQRGEGAGQTLGQILLQRHEVPREAIHGVIREQVQQTVYDLVAWRHGQFNFEVDELHPPDDFSLAPGDLLDDLDLNTQMLLLDAARIFDERHRYDSTTEADREKAALEERLKRAGLSRGRRDRDPASREPASELRPPPIPDPVKERVEPSTVVEAVRCQVVSEDRALAQRLKQGLPAELARVVAVRLREAGNRVPGETSPPIVVLDLRPGDFSPDDLASLARTRPGALLVAVAATSEQRAAAFAAGAVAVVEATGEQVVHCCHNLIRRLSRPQTAGGFGDDQVGGFSRFRRVVFDVQTGLLSATMALNLMHVISESVERAVLFLVQGDVFAGVGAFGFSATDRPLAELTRGLRLDPSPHSAFRRAVEEAKPQSTTFDAAELPEEFSRLIGPPASGQVVIFPVMGARRAISVIYTDNGREDREIEDIRILELATAQVGVAFENELLRRQLRGRGLDAVLE